MIARERRAELRRMRAEGGAGGDDEEDDVNGSSPVVKDERYGSLLCVYMHG